MPLNREHEVEFIQEKNFNTKQGTSGLLKKLAKNKKYLLVGCTLTNLFFVDEIYKNKVLGDSEINFDEIRNDKNIKNIIISPEENYNNNGSIKFHILIITNKKFQILPSFLRRFPDDYNFFQKFLFLVTSFILYKNRFIKKIKSLFGY